MTPREVTDELTRMAERYRMEESRRRVRMVAEPQNAGNAQAIPETPQSGPDLNEYAYVGAPSPPVQGEPGMPSFSPPSPPAPTAGVLDSLFYRLRGGRRLPQGAETLFGRGQEIEPIPGEASVRPYKPTMRDQFANALIGDRRMTPGQASFVEGALGSRGLGTTGMSLTDFTPMGSAFNAEEEMRKGDAQKAALSVLPFHGAIKAGKAAMQPMTPRVLARDTSGRPISRAPLSETEQSPNEILEQINERLKTTRPSAAVDNPEFLVNARNKGAGKYPHGSPEQRAATITDVETKNLQTPNDPRWEPPEGPEFWPWRVQVGTHQLGQNPATHKSAPNKFFAERVMSDEERELQKLITKAQQEVKAGKDVTDFFPLEQHKKQPQRGEVLPLEERAKGVPAHVTANVAPGSGAEERLMTAANRAPEEAKKWYWTGNYLDDLTAIHGPKEAQRRLDRLGNYMGATTSDATPPSNVRMATYQMALNEQQRAANALPGSNQPPIEVPHNPQYPYGHARYQGTHRPILEEIAGGGRINSRVHPKGAEFAGSIGGYSDKAVLDRVMMEDVLQAQNAGRTKLLQTPEPGTYGTYRDWMDDVAKKHGLTPDELQAMGWVGHNPEKFEQYRRTLQQHISDRVNVTAKVMSAKAGRKVHPEEVYDGHLRHGWPLLTVAPPIALGAASDEKE